MVLCQTLIMAPAITTALLASRRIFTIIDTNPKIVSQPGRKTLPSDGNKSVDFLNVNFSYPSRPHVPVLRSLNMEVLDGQRIGLVGASGCGKSTTMMLLQRFYTPQSGEIFLGSDEISRDISISDLRSQISIVSQEPLLFDRTIFENIAYGEWKRTFTMEDVIAAAKTANIHGFISALPLVSLSFS